jgi:hypothetical protein
MVARSNSMRKAGVVLQLAGGVTELCEDTIGLGEEDWVGPWWA